MLLQCRFMLYFNVIVLVPCPSHCLERPFLLGRRGGRPIQVLLYYVWRRPTVPPMSGHLSCTDTSAWSRGCPFMTDTTVYNVKALALYCESGILPLSYRATLWLHSLVAMRRAYTPKCTHTHTHTNTHTNTHTHTHTHMHMYTHTHTHTHTHIYTHTHAHARTRTQIHTHTHTHIHMHAHTHTHIHMHAHSHTHTHVHTHEPTPPPPPTHTHIISLSLSIKSFTCPSFSRSHVLLNHSSVRPSPALTFY